MNKETVFSILRHLLSAVGAFIIGRQVFGLSVDESVWQTILGVVMSLVGVIWSFFDKTATIEGVQGVIRQLVTVVGGFFVAAGRLKEEVLTQILAFIAVIGPIITSFLGRKKTQQLKNGQLKLAALKGETAAGDAKFAATRKN